MFRFLKSKLFYLLLVTVLIFVVMGLVTSKGGAGIFNNIITVPLTPVQKFFTSAGDRIDSFFAFLNDINTLKSQNEELTIRVAELEKENNALEVLEEKNKELRQALDLKAQFENYDIVGANVIAKDPGNWFNVFRVDRGSKDSVIIGLTVVTASRSLVGRVMESDLTSAKVISIIDEDSAVSGWISKPGGGHVIVRGDLQLKDKGYCRMDYIPQDVDVVIGDTIETSGLGGVFPKGLVIGKVKEVRKAENELERFAIIEPAVNLKQLEEVFILRNK